MKVDFINISTPIGVSIAVKSLYFQATPFSSFILFVMYNPGPVKL